jgi:alkylated DNA repair dioxygenase AlkB
MLNNIAMSLGPDNFKIVRGMLGGNLLDFLGYYAYDRANSTDLMEDAQVPNTPALHDDPAMRTLLYYFLYDMTEHTGAALEPTYSYLRVYKKGDVLHRHTDKKACEYSVSLTLKREYDDEVWPLYLETDEVRKICLEEGDGLIYKGIDNPHWRDKFEGERLAQVFLHYVRR